MTGNGRAKRRLEFGGRTNDSRVGDSWRWSVRGILDVRKQIDADSPEAKAFWQAVDGNRPE